MNVHNIPPLLANAVIKKPDEPNADAICEASESASLNAGECVLPSSSERCKLQSESSQSWDSTDSNGDPIDGPSQLERSQTIDQFPSMANFLPENSFFYNDKNCYIFPGAEIWWNKDSDLESTSSDSSIDNDDDDDDDDIEDMEIATMEHNEVAGDVESTLAVENLLENTNEHEFNKYLLKRNTSTSLEHIHMENIDEGDMHDMNPKRLKATESELTLNYVEQHQHVEHATSSTMNEVLGNSNSNSGSSISCALTTPVTPLAEHQQQQQLPPPPLPLAPPSSTTLSPPAPTSTLSNEVFFPKL